MKCGLLTETRLYNAGRYTKDLWSGYGDRQFPGAGEPDRKRTYGKSLRIDAGTAFWFKG